MRARNPRDRKHLKIDLVGRLVSCGHLLSKNPVSKSDVESWFIEEERELASELVRELVEGDAPIEESGRDESRIGVVDFDDAEEYVDDLRDTPWFEF